MEANNSPNGKGDENLAKQIENLYLLVFKLSEYVQKLQPQNKANPQPKFYDVKEFAKKVKRQPDTVREWCRYKRINTVRSASYNGPYAKYKIPVAELQRYLDDGLLPPNRF